MKTLQQKAGEASWNNLDEKGKKARLNRMNKARKEWYDKARKLVEMEKNGTV